MPIVPRYSRQVGVGNATTARMPSALGYAAPTQGLRQLPPGVGDEFPNNLAEWVPNVIGGEVPEQVRDIRVIKQGQDETVQGMLANLGGQAAKFSDIQAETGLVKAKNSFGQQMQQIVAQASAQGGQGIDYAQVKQSVADAQSQGAETLSQPYSEVFQLWSSSQADKTLARLQGLEQSGIIEEAGQQRSLYMAQKQEEYGQVGTKQRALIEHEVAALLQDQAMSGLISPGQADRLYRKFVNNVSRDSVLRALNNALASGQPVASVKGVIKELESGSPSGLSAVTRIHMKGVATESLKQAENSERLSRLNAAMEDAWAYGGGEADQAVPLISSKSFNKKYKLDKRDKEVIAASLKARQKLMQTRIEKSQSAKATAVIMQVLELAEKGRPQNALTLIEVNTDELDAGAVKNLRALVLDENVQTSPQAWADALDAVFYGRQNPTVEWLLKSGVFPDKAGQLLKAYERQKQIVKSGEINYFKESIDAFVNAFGDSSKTVKQRKEFILNLWRATKQDNLDFASHHLLEQQKNVMRKVLLKMASSLEW